MNEKQRQGMIRFHERAAAAYKRLGVADKAKQAQAAAERLKKGAQS